VRQVAVLGAGIMGVATALCLARRGVRVTLFDAAPRACDGASRWNEGKIHLGYLYAGDASLETARRLLDGGLAFKPLIERLIGRSIEEATSPRDDVYLVHRHSIVDADAAAAYYGAVSGLVREHPAAAEYLAPAQDARAVRLSPADLEAICDPAHVVAGFRVPERSVSTRWIADRLVEAVAAEPRIEPRFGTRVCRLQRRGSGDDLPLDVITAAGIDGPFDAVVNALWEGRLALDATMGVPPPVTWSHRFRRALFVRTTRVVDVPSVVIATGPYGDVKNYTGRDLYVSWYPAGLAAEGSEVAAPAVAPLDQGEEARLADDVLASLGAILPSVASLRPAIASIEVGGGWVYAAGRGALDDPSSTLHRRDRAGILRQGSYISVDTGKYSIAPWLAERIAGELG
jgi:glycine/D-amino acid oxidase-like deaminating enzyme